MLGPPADSGCPERASALARFEAAVEPGALGRSVPAGALRGEPSPRPVRRPSRRDFGRAPDRRPPDTGAMSSGHPVPSQSATARIAADRSTPKKAGAPVSAADLCLSPGPPHKRPDIRSRAGPLPRPAAA